MLTGLRPTLGRVVEKTGHSRSVPAYIVMGWVSYDDPSLLPIAVLLSATLELLFVDKMS